MDISFNMQFLYFLEFQHLITKIFTYHHNENK